jgi:GH43 family beta-xylosidase
MYEANYEALANAIILQAPSYDGNWTDIQYVFTTTTQNRLRIVFTHLSQNGNNTCFDNFYLAELTVPSTSMINQVSADAPKADDRIYNLSGQEVTNPGKGVYIRNGKKFIIK